MRQIDVSANTADFDMQQRLPMAVAYLFCLFVVSRVFCAVRLSLNGRRIIPWSSRTRT